MSYSIYDFPAAFNAALETLIRTVEKSRLEADCWGFDASLLGPTKDSSLSRQEEIVRAFFRELPVSKQGEVISEASFGNELRFIDTPMVYVREYLAPEIATDLDKIVAKHIAESGTDYPAHRADQRNEEAA